MTRNRQRIAVEKIGRYGDVSDAVYRPFGNSYRKAGVRRSAKMQTLDLLYDQGYRTLEAIYEKLTGIPTHHKDANSNTKRDISRYLSTKQEH